MMDWKNYRYYFEELQDQFLIALFEQVDRPWLVLNLLTREIDRFFDGKCKAGDLPAIRTLSSPAGADKKAGSYTITENRLLTADFIDPELRIFIASGTLVEAGAMIKESSIIRTKCEIRQGAYIRGSVYIGEHSVVGHVTEIKNSIFCKHVEAGHFAYIGDSILGSYVNIGAGTKISNLQFRNREEKRLDQLPLIDLTVAGQRVDTTLSKFGAIVGDGGETGCNSVLSPFSLLATDCWVVPNLCVLKGVYPKGSLLKNIADCKKLQL